MFTGNRIKSFDMDLWAHRLRTRLKMGIWFEPIETFLPDLLNTAEYSIITVTARQAGSHSEG